MRRARLLGLLAVLAAGCPSERAPVRPVAPAPVAAVDAGVDAAPEVPDNPAKPALLTCADLEDPPTPGYCGVLEKAPRADPNSPAVKRAVEIWRRVEGPVRGVTGRETALVALAPGATYRGSPLPPAGFICPGAPPAVYLPDTLLGLIGSRYPEDFLAFVIGHELGHRINDLTPDGCQLASFQRPGKGVDEENLADARAAFFITGAGFSARRIARKDLVSAFLEAEFELGRAETKDRRDALLGALSSFDAYESLYQAGLGLALTEKLEAADRVLSWADELVAGHGVPLPELRVVRAIARINRAAEMAPWQAALELPVSMAGLRCAALHPGHTAFAEEPDLTVRGPDTERGRRLLLEARALLDQAELRGATPFTVAVARACASLYLGDHAVAEQAQKSAEKLAGAASPPVKAALAANRQLVDFVGWVRRNPPPSPERRDTYDPWVARLREQVGRGSPALVALAEALAEPDKLTPPPPADLKCRQPAPAKPAPLSPLPAAASGHGVCPAGWTLASALPSVEASRRTGSRQGMTACRRQPGDGELVTVRLASTTEPPQSALVRTARTMAPPRGLRDVNAWSCHCRSVRLQAASDRGELVYRVRCPALGVARGAVVVTGRHVATVIQHSR